MNHLNFGGHQPYLWNGWLSQHYQLSLPVSIINFWWLSDNCWSHPPSKSVFTSYAKWRKWFDYHMMRYGIFSMRWASASRESVGSHGHSCSLRKCTELCLTCLLAMSDMFAYLCCWCLTHGLLSARGLIFCACVHLRMKMVMLWLHFLLKTMSTHELCGTRTSKHRSLLLTCLTTALSSVLLI